MLGAGISTHALGGPSPFDLLDDYFRGSMVVTLTALMIWVFYRTLQLAYARELEPTRSLWTELKTKLPMQVLPLIVFPVFLASFTATKSAILPLVGFRFDHTFANLDKAVFATDPWRITHSMFGPLSTGVIQAIYVPIWVAALAYSQSLITFFGTIRTIGVFYTAMLLTWFAGGFVTAYLLSAAGPIFSHLIDAKLGSRFEPLKDRLANLLDAEAPFLKGPQYLLEGVSSPQAYYGGGISAMPSMHVAAVTIFVLAARRTAWFIPSCVFAAAIVVGSIHSGYHYAIDAPVAAIIAYASWQLAERWTPTSL
ncbi:hypothetical protein D3M59_05790 [Sphingomonas edaphi]|uniref:Inositolphosphotransferase Aur1/Ipt1 domain-containing protein n=2 Tax=Sphingomonas edaphi TaxID=2315689 RepID=A0A418Q3H2_9SPHN|nr:hypothetical protein D3M59_05790 [Sphingomonas edaphi]